MKLHIFILSLAFILIISGCVSSNEADVQSCKDIDCIKNAINTCNPAIYKAELEIPMPITPEQGQITDVIVYPPSNNLCPVLISAMKKLKGQEISGYALSCKLTNYAQLNTAEDLITDKYKDQCTILQTQ